ncbi:hypothetical protein GOP47_0008125 [Adiantum capillus-veneris]|uniref:Uncharacterized protein n=1 Tax=Adiantum capillus-veneris TaxID=13818 RepID=A0A9D4ZKD3_ADICA|nr:hypothetical protein GOP47_0008125 [Adiantum capillus-veneris]
MHLNSSTALGGKDIGGFRSSTSTTNNSTNDPLNPGSTTVLSGVRKAGGIDIDLEGNHYGHMPFGSSMILQQMPQCNESAASLRDKHLGTLRSFNSTISPRQQAHEQDQQ